MKIGAVLTGDIVDSTKLTLAERDIMLDKLFKLDSIISSIVSARIEIFRGDSFQVEIEEVESSLRVALIIRSYLREENLGYARNCLDARISLGIGSMDYRTDKLSTSDGEAYRFSGRLLEEMKDSRLKIKTPWLDVNEELQLSTAFADDIISSWTSKQSEVISTVLLIQKGRNVVARELEKSRQAIDKSLKVSKYELIEAYIKRFEILIKEKIKK